MKIINYQSLRKNNPTIGDIHSQTITNFLIQFIF
jgi:hypothetical protein